MVYARSPTLGLTVWLVSGSGASPRAEAEALVEMVIDGASTGNRGTGLAPGAWRIGGGFQWLGRSMGDAEIDIDVVSVDDSALTVNILDSSVMYGTNLRAGGYQGVTMAYTSHSFGWFDTRRGYYVQQSMCTVGGQCITEAFIQENQNKIMVHDLIHPFPTPGGGSGPSITAWLVSGSGASPRAEAEALVEMVIDGASTGNRGTGLAPGAWRT